MIHDPKYPCDNGCDCNCDIDPEKENSEAMRYADIETAVDTMLEDIRTDWDGIHRELSSETERY